MPESRPAAAAGAQRRIVERPAPEIGSELSKSLSPRMAKIYSARGIGSMNQLDLTLGALLLPRELDGAVHAAGLLADAVTAGRHIRFVGDFDADGATSSVVGVAALRAMGCARVSFIVPNRFEFGYGLTPEIVAIAMADKPDVLVTVDNGISSVEGVRAARAAGATVIITDHHLPGREIPDANAIVNPNLPGCGFGSPNLAGVGVIFYVLTLLRTELRERGWFERIGIEPPNMADFLDLVSLGTVADVVPLDHNNRILVQQGLRRINAGKARPGIRALCEAAGRPMATLSAADLGFGLAPRLNAAGRLDDMSIGIRCLLADNLIEARSLATALEELNESRKAIQQQMTQEAELSVAAIDLSGELQLGLCVYREGWHQGVVGIVAGRVEGSVRAAGDRVRRCRCDGAGRIARICPIHCGGTHPRCARCDCNAISGTDPTFRWPRDGRRIVDSAYSPRTVHRCVRDGSRPLGERGSNRRNHSQRRRTAWRGTRTLAGRRNRAGRTVGPGFPGADVSWRFRHGQSTRRGRASSETVAAQRTRVSSTRLHSIRRRSKRAQRAQVAYRLSRNDFRDRATLQLVVEHIVPV